MITYERETAVQKILRPVDQARWVLDAVQRGIFDRGFRETLTEGAVIEAKHTGKVTFSERVVVWALDGNKRLNAAIADFKGQK